MEDNFEFFDESKWTVGSSNIYHPRRPQQWYGKPEVKDGKGVFFVKHNPRKIWVYQHNKYHTFPFETSRIRSKLYQKYGRFECRMSLTSEPHSWPAFWLWGAPWPPEIDVIEAYGCNRQEINLHWGEGDNPEMMGAWKLRLGKRDFHEFAVEWSPDKIEFFTNGVKVFVFKDRELLDRWFGQGMWVVVNNAIKQEPESTDYYSEFLVDYVRVYRRPGQS